MANTTKAKKTTGTTKSSSAKKTTAASSEAKAINAETPVVKKQTFKDLDPNQLIPVYNGFQGKLVYKSPRTGEVFRWENFGDMQEIEIKELRNAKSSAKKFYINNWFMFDAEYYWVIDYLGVYQYYKDALTLESFDDIFTASPAEIKSRIAKLSDGQKKSVGYRARELVLSGEIDSNKSIAALEDALGIELIER